MNGFEHVLQLTFSIIITAWNIIAYAATRQEETHKLQVNMFSVEHKICIKDIPKNELLGGGLPANVQSTPASSM